MRPANLLLVFPLLLAIATIYAQEPKTAADYYRRGEERAGNFDMAGAVADYTSAIELDRKFGPAYCGRAHAWTLKNDSHTIADWNKCISLAPAHDKSLFTDHLERGYAKARKNDHDGAIADFTTSIRLRSNYWSYQARAKEYFAKMLLDRTRKRQKAERTDFEKALSDYNWLLKKSPDYWMYFRDRGRLYAARYKYNDALADFTKAIDLDAKEDPPYKDRAAVYRQLGRIVLATADEKRAAEVKKP